MNDSKPAGGVLYGQTCVLDVSSNSWTIALMLGFINGVGSGGFLLTQAGIGTITLTHLWGVDLIPHLSTAMNSEGKIVLSTQTKMHFTYIAGHPSLT